MLVATNFNKLSGMLSQVCEGRGGGFCQGQHLTKKLSPAMLGKHAMEDETKLWLLKKGCINFNNIDENWKIIGCVCLHSSLVNQTLSLGPPQRNAQLSRLQNILDEA